MNFSAPLGNLHTGLPLTAWLDLLRAVMPPSGIALVGAGNGTGPLVQWLIQQSCHVLLIEGDEVPYQNLQHVADGRPMVAVQRDVIVPQRGPTTFYRYNNSAENGLLPLERVQALWPNMQLTDQFEVEEAITLDSALQSGEPASYNWLLLDFQDSLALLQEDQQVLNRANVVLCRVVDEEHKGNEPNRAALNAAGLSCIQQLSAGRHPKVLYTLWARNLANLQQKLEVETKTRQEEAVAKTEALRQRDELAKAKAELAQRLADLQQKLEAETKTRQEEAVAKTEALRQRDEQANALQQSTIDAQQARRQAVDLQKQVDSAMARVAKLQLKLQATQADHARALSPQIPQTTSTGFNPTCTAEFNLGEAWAGNTVNTVIFRHHGIFTHQGHQFTSFYVDEHTLRFVCRRLSDDQITQYDLAGEYNLKDAHNSISMGVDRDGYLHVCFDHHASKLRYRRSLRPMSIDGWTDDQPMTGQYEDKVTYPTFILPRAGYPLTLLYRDGTHNKGCARLKYYDERTCSWKDKPTPILSGVDQKPWTSNAYWNHPAIGTDGSLHLSFVWRTGVLGEEQLVNNINIGYAWSPDNGHHWYTLQGQPYQAPITPTTAETIWPVPPGSNLINQCSMALDAYNCPHIVFYANDADGIPQYQHLRYDGKTWKHQVLSQRTQAFNLTGGGTLQIPISRPEVLLDAQGNALVIYRGDLTDDRMMVTKLTAPHYVVADSTQHVLHTDPLGHAEPVLDREGWKLNQTLCMLLQHNRQPNHDENITTATAPVLLCQFEL